jgi:hypothetical protein
VCVSCACTRIFLFFFYRIITFYRFDVYDIRPGGRTARVVASATAVAEPIRPAMALFRIRFYGVAKTPQDRFFHPLYYISH